MAAVLSLYWLGTSADLDRALALVKRTDLLPLAAAVLLLLASLAAKALRWRALLPSDASLSRREAFRIFHVSIFLNNVLPFRLGDGARILSPSVRRDVPARQALLVLVFERLLDALFLAAVALLVLPLFGSREVPDVLEGVEEVASASTGLTASAVGAGAVAFVLLLRRLQAGRRIGRWLASLRSDLRAIAPLGSPAVSKLLGWTLLAWLGTFLLHYVLLDAVGYHGTFLLAVVVTLATNFAMLVPATPANLGVFHAAAAAPLLAVGAPPDLSIAYAVVAHAVNTAPPLLLGALCLAAPWLASATRAVRGVRPS